MIEAFFANPFAVLGAFLLASFAGYVAWRNNFKSRHAAACSAFRAAILTELGSVYPVPVDWPDNVDAFFKSRFIALQSAVETFSHFVPWWHRRGFRNAWHCFYCAYPDKTTEQCYHHYYDSYDPFTSSQKEATEKRKKLFHANVERLLSYAKET